MNISEEIIQFLSLHYNLNKNKVYNFNQNYVNILISGISCSGKTTLSNEIKKYFSQNYIISIVSQDNYFKNIEDIPIWEKGYLTDILDAFHINEFKEDINLLLKNGFVNIPNYDIEINKRISKSNRITLGNINIFEGLHTILSLNDLDNCIKVFIDTDKDICLNRRIQRDFSKYNVPKKIIENNWINNIIPMYEKYIFSQKEMADIIIH